MPGARRRGNHCRLPRVCSVSAAGTVAADRLDVHLGTIVPGDLARPLHGFAFGLEHPAGALGVLSYHRPVILPTHYVHGWLVRRGARGRPFGLRLRPLQSQPLRPLAIRPLTLLVALVLDLLQPRLVLRQLALEALAGAL